MHRNGCSWKYQTSRQVKWSKSVKNSVNVNWRQQKNWLRHKVNPHHACGYVTASSQQLARLPSFWHCWLATLVCDQIKTQSPRKITPRPHKPPETTLST